MGRNQRWQWKIRTKKEVLMGTLSGWWFQPTPLKNDGVRQLGWWHSHIYIYIYYGKTKFMFQTTNQISKKILKSIGQERLSTFTSRGIEIIREVNRQMVTIPAMNPTLIVGISQLRPILGHLLVKAILPLGNMNGKSSMNSAGSRFNGGFCGVHMDYIPKVITYVGFA